jgi:choloylglycine hydrolase
MKNYGKIFAVFAVCFLFICLEEKTGNSCTTFCFDHGGKAIFGRNFDWATGKGMVIINKRGISKTALPYDSSNRLTWVSTYGSATFNQIGREFPYGGMNEAGLVVETMMLGDTEYPPLPDVRPEIGLYQWIQYQLDNFSTIEEVIDSNSRIRIKAKIGAHFLVCDSTGNCATIEFLGGRLVYHTKEKLPVRALSNSKYSEAIHFWKKDQIPQNDRRRSIGRFIRAANIMEKYDSQTEVPVDYAFKILSSVANPSDTQWSLVYDIANLGIYFRTRENRKIRYFLLKAFDFSCATPVNMLDINADFSGYVTDRFSDYNYQINRNMVKDMFKNTSFLIDMFSGYPEKTFCIEE